MPLTSPSSGGITVNSVGDIQERVFAWDINSAGNDNILSISRFENGESIVSGTNGKVGFLNDLESNRPIQFAALATSAPGLPGNTGEVRSAIRSKIDGSIWCRIFDAAVGLIVRSIDNGVSWTQVPNPGFAGQADSIVETANGRIWVNANTAANNIAFTDNGGINWTIISDGMGAAGTQRTPMLVTPDGGKVIFHANSQSFVSYTDEIAAAIPIITTIDLNATLGQVQGPIGSGADISDDNLTYVGVSQTGVIFYSLDGLSTVQLIPQESNPLLASGTLSTGMGCVYSPRFDGFFILTANRFIGAFLPASNPLLIKPILSSNNANIPSRGAADAIGNLMYGTTSAANRVTLVGGVPTILTA